MGRDRESRPHPDFERAPAARRWKGSLSGLLATLTHEARKSEPEVAALKEDKGWCWRVLFRGAFVGLRYRRDLDHPFGPLELRIARREVPKDAGAWGKFEAEVGVFLRAFSIEPTDGERPASVPGVHWHRTTPPLGEGSEKAEVRLTSLRLGEIRTGVAYCHRCLQDNGELQEVPWFASGGVRGQTCRDHAMGYSVLPPERGKDGTAAHE